MLCCGRTESVVAEQLGVSRSAVRNRLQSALERLRPSLMNMALSSTPMVLWRHRPLVPAVPCRGPRWLNSSSGFGE
jgi:hypothetical protein